MRAYNTEIEVSKEWLMSKVTLEIWNPEKIALHVKQRLVRRGLPLYYRAKGVVESDRVLNREYVE